MIRRLLLGMVLLAAGVAVLVIVFWHQIVVTTVAVVAWRAMWRRAVRL